MTLLKGLLGVCLLACAMGQATKPTGKTLRVYHIGNSVTDTINYKGLRALAESRGDRYVYGRHMMPGTPLVGLWTNQEKGFSEPPFGRSKQALTQFEWDVVTLQPFDRLLEGDAESDFVNCSNFIETALPKSPNVQVYIYQRWPKRPIIGTPKYDGTDKCANIDYAALWNRPYTGNWDMTFETHDYFDRLAEKLNAAFGEKLKHPVKVVPVGDVMAKLDEAIRAGEVPGLTSINDLYVDNVHLNPLGHYLAGLTFYATMFDADVSGIGSAGYGKLDPKQAEAVAKCVMAVCRPS